MKEARSFLVVGAASELGRAVSARLAEHGPVLGVRRPGDPALPEDGALCCEDLEHASRVRELIAGEAYARDVETVVYLPPTWGASHRRQPCAPATELRLLLDALEQQPKIRGFVMASSALVYRVETTGVALADERHPLELSPSAPPAVGALVEADVLASLRIPSARLHLAVLRLSGIVGGEMLAHRTPAFRPLGFDPMVNVLSPQDAAAALALAAAMRSHGMFNIPGFDTLPLSELIHRMGRASIPVPPAALRVLGRLGRARLARELALARLDHALILDGGAARTAFGYEPRHPIAFPR